MSSSNVKLIYISSESIIDFIRKNPVIFRDRYLADLHGLADQAGMTPTPVVSEFLELISSRKSLFGQNEFADHCTGLLTWADWVEGLNPELLNAVKVKLKCNFYVSMIDTLHAWALLVEAKWFDICYLDCYEDVLSKSDITLIRNGKEVHVSLIGPRGNAPQDYKRNFRKRDTDKESITIQLKFKNKDGIGKIVIGGKRWYVIEDFEDLNPNQKTVMVL